MFEARILAWQQWAHRVPLNRKPLSHCQWCLVCLCYPFYWLFSNPYSHITADQAARMIFKYCRANREYMINNPLVIQQIEDKILNTIDRRSSYKYKTIVDQVRKKLNRLKLPNPPQKIPEKEEEVMSFENQRWKWPKNLSFLGITAEQKDLLNLVISTLVQTSKFSPKIEILKSQKNHTELQIEVSNDGFHRFTLPFRIRYVIEDQELQNVVVLSRKIIDQGGQRNVRLSFNPFKSKYYVRKRATSETEILIVETLSKRKHRGLVSVKPWQEISSSGVKRTKFLEPLYEMPLTELFGTYHLTKFQQKLFLIEDLLFGLQAFHSHQIENICFGDYTGSFKWFHYDLKPDNILVRRNLQTGGFEAAITDFGHACNTDGVGGSNGYRSPERVQRYLTSSRTTHDNFVYQAQHGQSMDIWSMGLIFVGILIGRGSEKAGDHFPPLPCLEEGFLKDSKKEIHFCDAFVAELTQDQIDRDLDQLKAAYPASTPEKQLMLDHLWKMVKQMLRVKPEERITAEEALKQFKEYNHNSLVYKY